VGECWRNSRCAVRLRILALAITRALGRTAALQKRLGLLGRGLDSDVFFSFAKWRSMDALVAQFKNFGAWRRLVTQRIVEYRDGMAGLEPIDARDEPGVEQVLAMLAENRLTIAVVAEFSRGKSELINAIFFAGYGQRILPSAAGRTTMCPTELSYDPEEPPSIRLLPIETRTWHGTVTEYKALPQEWVVLPLDINSGRDMLTALHEVSRTKRVPVDEARQFGMFDESDPEQAAAATSRGTIEIPRWRHAHINFPHPLLREGLVILDTPGLSAVGLEPELALNEIPNAHAVLFILAANSPVTRGDAEVWRRHLGKMARHGRMVVLNKIDALWNDLKSVTEAEIEINRQVMGAARMLEVDVRQIYPVSAQKALWARINRDEALLKRTRLTQLETALSRELFAQRQLNLAGAVRARLLPLIDAQRACLATRLAGVDLQLEELSGLRGKNRDMIEQLAERLRFTSEEFDKTMLDFQSVRTEFARLSSEICEEMGEMRLREDTCLTREAMNAAPLAGVMRDAMSGFLDLARRRLDSVQEKCAQITRLLADISDKLANEHALHLALPRPCSLGAYIAGIEETRALYQEHFGTSAVLSNEKGVLLQKYFESIASRIQKIWEIASGEVETWLQLTLMPIESQAQELQTQLQRRAIAAHQVSGAEDVLVDNLQALQNWRDDIVVMVQQLDAHRMAINSALDAPVGADRSDMDGSSASSTPPAA